MRNNKIKYIKDDKGITLLALVISIVIMLILAGASINGVLNPNTIDKAKEVTFKSEAKDIKDAWEAKIIGIDATYLDYDDISKVLNDAKARPELLKKLEIQNGKLVYKEDKCTPEEIEWLESIGIFGSFSIIANVKTNARIIEETVQKEERQASDVILILDVSGSMRAEDDGVSRAVKMTNVLNVTMKDILKKNVKNRIGLVSFDGTAKIILPLDHYYLADGASNFLSVEGNKGGVNGYDIKTVDKNGKVLMLDSKGQNINKTIEIRNSTTYIQGGLKNAYDLLKGRTDKNNLPAIILITDGAPYRQYCNMEKQNIDNTLSPVNTDDPILRGYNVFLTFVQIKKNIKDIRLYNINIADYKTNPVDRCFTELMLNPSNAIIEASKKLTSGQTSSSDLNGLNYTTLKTFAEKVESKIKSDPDTNYFYADGFSVGTLSEAQLNELFKEFLQDIENNLAKEITISSDSNITGVYQLDSDNLTFKTTKGPNGKTEDGTDVEGTYYFELHEKEKVYIKIKAAAFKGGSEDSKPEKIEGTEVTITSQDITVQDIKDGIEPNLYYIDGIIKWNVRSVYKEEGGLASQALDAVKLPSGDCQKEIVEVIIELPVKIKEFIPNE